MWKVRSRPIYWCWRNLSLNMEEFLEMKNSLILFTRLLVFLLQKFEQSFTMPKLNNTLPGGWFWGGSCVACRWFPLNNNWTSQQASYKSQSRKLKKREWWEKNNNYQLPRSPVSRWTVEKGVCFAICSLIITGRQFFKILSKKYYVHEWLIAKSLCVAGIFRLLMKNLFIPGK